MRGPYRGQNNAYTGRNNNNYPQWNNNGQGQSYPPPPQEQRAPPYRPPGYQEEPPAWAHGYFERFDRKLDGVQSQLGNFDAWRKNVDSQLGNLAAQIPRPQGQLPGRPEENPRAPQHQNEVRSIGLRSGQSLPKPQVPRTREESRTELPSNSGLTCQDIEPDVGRGPLTRTEEGSKSCPTCPEVGPTTQALPGP